MDFCLQCLGIFPKYEYIVDTHLNMIISDYSHKATIWKKKSS